MLELKSMTKRQYMRAAAVIAALWTSTASAGTAVLTLTRDSLNSVTDSAGTTQYETGAITTAAGAGIGFYNIARRYSTSGEVGPVLNAASETINLVLATAPTSPYQNVTVEGVHSFSTGAFAGSTSAASAAYKYAIGGSASATPSDPGITILTLSLKGHHTIP
jgi:hypothetical protein